MKKYNFLFTFMFVFILLTTTCFAKSFDKVKEYKDTFKDVKKDTWYSQGISDVFELGLMDGISDDTFDINGNLTVAQAITIGARLHSMYNGTEIAEVKNSKAWYDKYVKYCENNGIITKNQFNSYTRSIMSWETVTVFAKALPQSFYKKINNVDAILDVSENVSFANDVFMFYNAGILCGNDDYGTFLPTENITRARAASIISRIAIPGNRQSFSLLAQQENYDIDTVFKIFSYQTKKDTLDKIILMNVDGMEISGALYRYFSYSNNGNILKIEKAIKSNVALIRLAQSSWLKISRKQLCDMLTYYYDSKNASYSSGSYYSALESNRLSDEVFARLTVTNELVTLLTDHFAANISPEAVSQYAKSNGYVCASHILISKDKDNAYKTIKEIETKLKNGEDFDILADKYGEDPGMKNRPDGYVFTKGFMVKEFEDAVFALKEGQISGVVTTDYGYHIIRRNAITSENITSGPEYSKVASEASVKFFSSEADKLVSSFYIDYAYNFDNLISVID